MTLFIAFLLIAGLHLGWRLYPVAIGVWMWHLVAAHTK